MTQITIDEPRTVVEKRTKYECDHCGYWGDEDEMVEVQFRLINGSGGPLNEENRHLCDNHIDVIEAYESQRKKRNLANHIIGRIEKMRKFGYGVSALIGFCFGVWMLLSFGAFELDRSEAPEQLYEAILVESMFATISFFLVCGLILAIGVFIGFWEASR